MTGCDCCLDKLIYYQSGSPWLGCKKGVIIIQWLYNEKHLFVDGKWAHFLSDTLVYLSLSGVQANRAGQGSVWEGKIPAQNSWAVSPHAQQKEAVVFLSQSQNMKCLHFSSSRFNVTGTTCGISLQLGSRWCQVMQRGMWGQRANAPTCCSPWHWERRTLRNKYISIKIFSKSTESWLHRSNWKIIT